MPFVQSLKFGDPVIVVGYDDGRSFSRFISFNPETSDVTFLPSGGTRPIKVHIKHVTSADIPPEQVKGMRIFGLKMTQTEFAKFHNVTRNTVVQWEAGEEISEDNLVKLNRTRIYVNKITME